MQRLFISRDMLSSLRKAMFSALIII